MIYSTTGIGQVATATLALDPSDRLELAEGKKKRAGDRLEEMEGGGEASHTWAGGRPEVLTAAQ